MIVADTSVLVDALRGRPAATAAIDVADFLVAATAMRADAELWTRNVEHFPTFEALEAPY